MATIASLVVALGADSVAFTRDLRHAATEVERFSARVNATTAPMTAAGAASGRAATQVSAFGSAVRALGAITIAVTGVLSLAAAFTHATDEAGKFGLKMAQISATLGTTAGGGAREAGVRALARQFGTSSVEQASALFAVVKAEIRDTSRAMEVLTGANRLAVAGVADVTEAARGLTAVLNAYGSAAGSVTQITDAFFTAEQHGTVTIGQFVESIGKVAPIAHAAGISLDEMLAAISTLTRAGIEPSLAATYVRALLTQIIKPAQDNIRIARELGIEFNATALKAKGLQRFLLDVTTAAKGNSETLAKLFSDVRAIVPGLALGGEQAKNFADLLDLMAHKAGATDKAFNIVAGSTQFRLNRAMAEMRDVMLGVGQSLLQRLLPALEGFARALPEIVRAVRALAAALGTAGLGYAVFVVTRAIQSLSLASFAALLSPAGIVITAVAALAVVFYGVDRAINKTAEDMARFRSDISLMSQGQLAGLYAELLKREDLLNAQIAAREKEAELPGGRHAMHGVLPQTIELEELHTRMQAVLDAFKQARAFAAGSPFGGITPPEFDPNAGIIDPAGAYRVAAEQLDIIRDRFEALAKPLTTYNDLMANAAERNRQFAPLIRQVEADIARMQSLVTAARGPRKAPDLVAIIKSVETTLERARAEQITDASRIADVVLRQVEARRGATQVAVTRSVLSEVESALALVAKGIEAAGGVGKAPTALLTLQTRLLEQQGQVTTEVLRQEGAFSTALHLLSASATRAAAAEQYHQAILFDVSRREREDYDQIRQSLHQRAELLKRQFTGGSADNPAYASLGARALQEVASAGLDVAEQFGPLAILAKALGYVLEAAQPIIDAFMVPLRIVAQVIATLLIPILRLLFPVIQFFSIQLALAGEIIARIMGFILQGAGQFLIGIGRLINLLPGSLGRPLIQLGKLLLQASSDARDSARQFAQARKDIYKMSFDDAMAAVDQLGQSAKDAAEALRNVPSGWRIALARFEATIPVAGQVSAPSTSVTASQADSHDVYYVAVDARDRSMSEVFEEIKAEAVRRGRSLGVPSTRAYEAFAR